jgi:hypothetical protein
MPKGKPGTGKPKPPDLRETPAKGKPLDGSKNPGGKPKEWTDERISDLADKLEEWAASGDAKFLETFCQENQTYPQRLSEFAKDNAKFAEVLKIAKAACASSIAKATFLGICPPAFGIFTLKQHGWTDKQEIEHSGEVKSTVVTVELPRKK